MGGHLPDITVFRHPVVALYDPDGKVVVVQEDIIKAIAGWGEIIAQKGKQMLISVKTSYEQGLLTKALQAKGVGFSPGQNNFCPDVYDEIWGEIRMKIDSHTIKIG